MKQVQFISNSTQIKSIVKNLTLTQSLFVSSILIGEPYTGKKRLVQSLFPKAFYIDANNMEELEKALNTHNEIVIYNFESITNIETLNFENKRIVAIANKVQNSSLLEKKFAFIYHMPSLQERPEDVELLIEHFTQSIQEDLVIPTTQKISSKNIDLSENIKSLKASIYKQLITSTLTHNDIEQILFDYLYENIEGKNAYRDYLGIYEKPLIKAGLKKFKSQLKLSSVLGLNRNTLRKKIHEHNLD
ncbi:MAG: Fis family transcriptional regulator [Epsilonproteobacteria bacterium]|nr:Fis family transcriptional regulator [Campylobacterota bacterium]